MSGEVGETEENQDNVGIWEDTDVDRIEQSNDMTIFCNGSVCLVYGVDGDDHAGKTYTIIVKRTLTIKEK